MIQEVTVPAKPCPNTSCPHCIPVMKPKNSAQIGRMIVKNLSP